MVTETRIEQEDGNAVLDTTGTQEAVPAEVEKPTPPKGVSDEEVQVLRARAVDLVNELGEADGSRELELVDGITSLGVEAQRTAAGELDLLRARVRDMLSQRGPSAEIAEDLLELRMALNQINPHELRQPGGSRRVISWIPFVGKFTPALKVLNKIAIRYESVSAQVTMIETKLHDGAAMLVRDNVEMRKLYEQVEAQQLPIQKNAFLGENVMQQLSDLLERTDDTFKAERIRNALHDVSMRVQDLRTMEEVHIQFFVSIEMTRQNNHRLGQSVDRTLALGSNVVMVGLAIQSALTRQKRVLEATQRTREFLGNLIVANAAAIRQHVQEIGDVYNNPVIAIDKITRAHNDLIEATNAADQLRQEGIDSARENIVKLTQLSADLQQRTARLPAPEEAAPPSIEA